MKITIEFEEDFVNALVEKVEAKLGKATTKKKTVAKKTVKPKASDMKVESETVGKPKTETMEFQEDPKDNPQILVGQIRDLGQQAIKKMKFDQKEVEGMIDEVKQKLGIGLDVKLPKIEHKYLRPFLTEFQGKVQQKQEERNAPQEEAESDEDFF